MLSISLIEVLARSTVKMQQECLDPTLYTLGNREAWVTDVAFSGAGYIVSTRQDGTLDLWEINDRKLLRSVQVSQVALSSLNLAPNAPNSMVAGSLDGTMIVIEDFGTYTQSELAISTSTSGILDVKFSPTGELIASATGDIRGSDNTVRVWSTSTLDMIHELRGHTWEVTSLAFSRNGEMLASGDGDGNIITWDVQTGELIEQWVAHQSWVQDLVFSPTEAFLVSVGRDGAIVAWNATLENAPLFTVWHGIPLYSVAFSADGQVFATGDAEGVITIWDAETFQQIGAISAHPYPVLSLDFNPVDNTLASGSTDGLIKVWCVN